MTRGNIIVMPHLSFYKLGHSVTNCNDTQKKESLVLGHCLSVEARNCHDSNVFGDVPLSEIEEI